MQTREPTTSINRPDLSIIIPVRGSGELEAAIGRLALASTEFEYIEVIGVKGTAVSQQRNLAVKLAKSPFLYFIDDDSCVQSSTLAEGLRLIRQSKIDVVGGPAVTRRDAGFWERCFGEVIAVPFGGWRTCARIRPIGNIRKVDGEELNFCNVMMRKSWYEKAAGMDERLYPGEDVDLVKRLRELGATMYYNPKMVVSRPRRRSVTAFIRQYYSYGLGRGMRVTQGFRWQDLVYLLPSFFLCYLVCLVLLLSSLPVSALPLLLYWGLCLFSAGLISRRTSSLGMGLACILLFPCLHLSYGAGMMVGMARPVGGIINAFLSTTVVELAYGTPRSRTCTDSPLQTGT